MSSSPSCECPICLDVYDEPKMLNCGHSFCDKCIKNMQKTTGIRITCPECRRVTIIPKIGLATNFALARMVEDAQNQEPHPLPPVATPEISNDSTSVLIMGGLGTENLLETYNPDIPNINQLLDCQLECGRFGHVAGLINDHLYVVGGERMFFHTLKSTEVFNLSRNEWSQFGQDMSVCRCYFAAATVNQHLFVFGGAGLSSCELLNPNTNSWLRLPDMKFERSRHAAVELNSKIFLIGGIADGNIPNLTSIYDVNSGRWEGGYVSDKRRFGLGAARWGSCIVTTGGLCKDNLENSCQMLDPREKRWRPIDNLNVKRHGHTLVNFNNKLLAMGGSDGRMPLDSVEQYDPSANRWTIVEPLKTIRKNFAAVVIR